MLRKVGWLLFSLLILTGVALSFLPTATAQESEQGWGVESNVVEQTLTVEEFRLHLLDRGFPPEAAHIWADSLLAMEAASLQGASFEELQQITEQADEQIKTILNITSQKPSNPLPVDAYSTKYINASCSVGARGNFSFVNGSSFGSYLVQTAPALMVHQKTGSCVGGCTISHKVNAAGSYAQHTLWVSGQAPFVYNHVAKCL